MENYYYYLIKNLLALSVIAFIIAPANLKVSEPINHHIIPDLSLQFSELEPVDQDFQDILDRGSIRVITNYGVGSYFLRGGLDRGFEYEFVSSFARKHGLTTEIVLLQPGDDPIAALNRGDGDIIAANFHKTPERKKRLNFSEPYNLVNQHIILPEGKHITSLEELNDIVISVRRNSAHHETLLDLKQQGHSINIDLVPENIDREALLVGVAEDRYEATILDDNQFNAMKTYVTGVEQGPEVSREVSVSWALRSNATQLQKEVDRYIYGNFKYDEEQKKIWRSGFLTILQNRYFTDEEQIEQFRYDIHELLHYGVLSPYDQLIRPAAEATGVDWKLAVAVMAQESSFRPEAVSIAGAVGLMQIIPRFSQVTDVTQLMDPETNIQEGMRYLNKHLEHYSYLDTENQLALTLATYNAGMGHLADARRLVIDSNKDPNDWDAIAEALLKLMDRSHHRHARYGYVRGTETVDYVQRIMGRYKTYQEIAKLAGNSDREHIEESLLAMGRINGD